MDKWRKPKFGDVYTWEELGDRVMFLCPEKRSGNARWLVLDEGRGHPGDYSLNSWIMTLNSWTGWELVTDE